MYKPVLYLLDVLAHTQTDLGTKVTKTKGKTSSPERGLTPAQSSPKGSQARHPKSLESIFKITASI